MAVFTGNGTVTAPSFTFSSDTDTGFYRYGDGDIGITLNGLLRARFEGAALNISNAAIKATPGVDQNLYIADNVSNAGIFIGRWGGGGDGCVNDFFANRGASVGTYTAPTSGDEISRFRFFTHDTTAFREVAGIFPKVGTYNGTDDVGGQIVFGTRPTGAGLNNREVFKITEEAYLRMASGSGGIQFNGDGAAANALDDYEEGTWTPTYSGWTSAPTAGTGRYIKVGKIVYLTLAIGTCTSATGGSTISGIPYDAGTDYDLCGLIVDQSSSSPVAPASGAVLGITLRSSTIYVERTALTLRDRSSLTITYRV